MRAAVEPKGEITNSRRRQAGIHPRILLRGIFRKGIRSAALLTNKTN